jgi:hypothetical protein
MFPSPTRRARRRGRPDGAHRAGARVGRLGPGRHPRPGALPAGHRHRQPDLRGLGLPRQCPSRNQNKIANGASAYTIANGISGVSQMRFLQGRLTQSDLNDLAAYIAAQTGRTPPTTRWPPRRRSACPPPAWASAR